MQRRAIQISVMRVDWSRWRGLCMTGHVSPRFAHLLREESAVRSLADAAAEPRTASLEDLLREKVARVLGTSPERLDIDKPLLNLGIDSLMAVELRNWIEKELQINVPIMELMRSPSLSRLTHSLRELSPNTESKTTPPQPTEPPQTTEDLLTKIEDMSDEDINAMLTALLDERSRNR